VTDSSGKNSIITDVKSFVVQAKDLTLDTSIATKHNLECLSMGCVSS